MAETYKEQLNSVKLNRDELQRILNNYQDTIDRRPNQAADSQSNRLEDHQMIQSESPSSKAERECEQLKDLLI
jgi:cellulose biosynthesis protein BcsQ